METRIEELELDVLNKESVDTTFMSNQSKIVINFLIFTNRNFKG